MVDSLIILTAYIEGSISHFCTEGGIYNFNGYNIVNETQPDTRYETAAIMQAKEITFDLTFDSFSNTAIDVIHDITRVIKAITVILFIKGAHALRRKQVSATATTVIIYLSHPPRLNRTGISSAVHIIPRSRHLRIIINMPSIYVSFLFVYKQKDIIKSEYFKYPFMCVKTICIYLEFVYALDNY